MRIATKIKIINVGFGTYSIIEKSLPNISYEFTDFDIARIGIGLVIKAQNYFKNKGVYIKRDLLVDMILKEVVTL